MGRKENNKRYYDKNRERHIQNVLERRQSIVEHVNDLKMRPCHDCGVSYPPYVMDFDHMDDKFMGISQMARYGYTIEKIDAEIAKCELVCANCHRERTHGPLTQ